ncbi:uncharacterized protein LOC106674338 isoform X2 [Cimex lectularius]|nr:uncharacterized protein LOC106674338 isoform X2 [Cimex lectularius]
MFSHYYTSVNDQDVKQQLLSFWDKFIFHGFTQKAKNLKILVNTYENSEYFKQSNAREKWGIIDLLIKLSYKPTDALEDDEPILLNDVSLEKSHSKEVPGEVPYLGGYIREGNEKLDLLTDEDMSFESDISSSYLSKTDPPTIIEDADKVLSLFKADCVKISNNDQKLDPLRKAKDLEEWLTKHSQYQWWKKCSYQHVPRKDCMTGHFRAEETFCLTWCKKMEQLGRLSENITVISEYKLLRELIWILAHPPEKNTYLISKNKQGFFVKNNFSIPTLSPLTFQNVMQTNFLHYLPFIQELMLFVRKVNYLKAGNPKLPNTYNSYAVALDGILMEYRKHLLKIETEVKKQETYFSLRRLYIELTTKNGHWLKLFKFIACIHRQAVYGNFEDVKNWMCSMRLLSVLYDHLRICVNWKKIYVFRLFLHSFRSYMDIIGSMMAGNLKADIKNEFVVYRSGLENFSMEVKFYKQFVKSLGGNSLTFWEPFVHICYRALSSVHFLSQLGNYSDFCKAQHHYSVLHTTFCQQLECVLLGDCSTKDEKLDKSDPYKCLAPFLGLNSDLVYIKKPQFFRDTIMFGDIFDEVFECYRKPIKPIFKKTDLENLTERLVEMKLQSHLTDVTIQEVAVKTIQLYMEPAGFICSILLNDYKLLEHFRSLRNVYFLQLIHPFTDTLYQLMREEKQWTYNWTEELRICINKNYPMAIAQKFSFLIGQKIALIESDNILELLSLVTLNYQVDSELRLVITEKILEEYNDLFRFLLQLRFAYILILSLRFNDLQEDKNNYLIVQSLFSLRMWLLHTMTTLNHHFCNVNEAEFEGKILTACKEARDLHTIQAAHTEFIISYKRHCFLTSKDVCKEPVQKIFRLCHRLHRMWYTEGKHLPMYETIKQFEKDYLTTIENFSATLHFAKYSGNENFALLFNEISNNLAVENVA